MFKVIERCLTGGRRCAAAIALLFAAFASAGAQAAIVVSPATLANGTQNVAYSRTLTAAGGTAPYGYAVTAGALPAGLALSAAGVMSGTPTANGTFTFTVTATDATAATGTRAYTLVIAPPTVAVAPSSLPNGRQNVAYSQAATSTGGTAPYTYAVTAGALPAGLTLASGGALSGTPSVNGSFTFTITSTDSQGYAGTRAYTLTIAVPLIALAPTTLPNGRQNVAYSRTLTSSGGTAPYTYAVTAGALPTGLTLSTGGVLSGTPTVNGSFAFTVTSTDSQGYSGSRAYTLVIAIPTIAVSPTTLANGTQNVAYSRALTSSGGTAPYTYAVTAGALPAGLALAAGGTLAGTPTVNGAFTFTVTSTDSQGYAGTRAYTLTIAPPVIAISPTTLAGGRQNVAYSQVLTSSGGTAPYTYAVTAGALPSGLTLAAGGTLSGTPTANGAFTFTVTSTDSLGYTGSRAYTLTIAVPLIAIAPTTLPNGRQNVAYAQTVTASGGAAPYAYAVTVGTLPAGLTLAAGGALSGTPTVNGSFTFTVTATDSQGFTSARGYTLVIAVPAITVNPASPLPVGRQFAAYSQTLTATGGVAPYTYAVTTGALPAGLSLSTGGGLSGVPTVSGSFSFTVTATDAQGFKGARAYTLAVSAGPVIALAPSSLPTGGQDLPYSVALGASGGTAPYGYALTSGFLPAGMTLSGTGQLSGTPSVSGTFGFTVTATDAQGYIGSRAYTVTIVAAPTITIAPGSLPSGNEDLAYSQTIVASGGNAPYAYVVSGGSLPAGMTLSSDGVLSGSPTVSGSFSFTVTATDALTYTGSQAYVLDVVAAPTITVAPGSLPSGNQNLAYSQSITASGGNAPYGYAVTAGSLPAGMTLSSSGVLSGSPSVSGSFSFTVTSTDALTYTGSQAYVLDVIPAPTISVAPGSLPSGNQNLAYSQNLAASGGNAPYGYAITSGSLPAGMTLSSSGVLSGSPSVSGSFSFTVTATDALTYTGSQAYVLDVIPAPTISVAPGSLPSGNQNLAYSQSITASGGNAPYGYAVTSGSLPAGMTLSSSGLLSGTPSASGSFSFTVTATDALTYTGSQAYVLDVIPAPTISVAPGSLPSGNQNLAYSQSITASGGNAPYGYAVTSGSLPAGVTLSSSGLLSGTPSVSGSFSFTVTATDALTYTGSQAYTLAVGAAPTITVAPGSLPSANQGLAYSQSITASGGNAPYGYAITSGSLPAGVTLSTDGVLSGTPAANGSYSFTVTATDALTYTGGQAYTLTVDTAPTIIIGPSALPPANQHLEYTEGLQVSGGTAPYSFSVTSGSLPAGMTLSTDGVLSGTPTASGGYSFTITSTDAVGYSASVAYTFVIDAAPTIVVEPGSLQHAVLGMPYSQLFSATGSSGDYTYAVASGSLPAGLTLTSDGTLSGTPTVAGTYGFTVTATDTQTYSGSRAYTLVVDARPDPTADPTLRNSVQAQVDALRRLAFAQLQNVNGRLERLRDCHDSSASMQVQVQDQGGFDVANGGDTTAGCDRPVAFWLAGTIVYGDDASAAAVHVPALTVGVDLRVSADVVLGLSIGAGSDTTRPGRDAENTAEGYSVMGYGAWLLGDVFRIEGVLGYGTAALTGKRVTSFDQVHVQGSRDADQLFGALTLAGDFLFGRLSLQPYLRTDYQSSSMDAYVERGDGPLAVRYYGADTDALQYAGGLRALWSLPVPFGLLQPTLRYEYRSLDPGTVDQAVGYADGIGGRYRLTLDQKEEDSGVVGVGLGFTFTDGVAGSIEYQTATGGDGTGESLFTGNVSWAF
ncbi:MAG: putative Ig domain-containing protein [Steroidobacteraceae bacterium]